MAPKNKAKQQPGNMRSRQQAKLNSQRAQKAPIQPAPRTGPRRQLPGSREGQARVGNSSQPWGERQGSGLEIRQVRVNAERPQLPPARSAPPTNNRPQLPPGPTGPGTSRSAPTRRERAEAKLRQAAEGSKSSNVRVDNTIGEGTRAETRLGNTVRGAKGLARRAGGPLAAATTAGSAYMDARNRGETRGRSAAQGAAAAAGFAGGAKAGAMIPGPPIVRGAAAIAGGILGSMGAVKATQGVQEAAKKAGNEPAPKKQQKKSNTATDGRYVPGSQQSRISNSQSSNKPAEKQPARPVQSAAQQPTTAVRNPSPKPQPSKPVASASETYRDGGKGLYQGSKEYRDKIGGSGNPLLNRFRKEMGLDLATGQKQDTPQVAKEAPKQEPKAASKSGGEGVKDSLKIDKAATQADSSKYFNQASVDKLSKPETVEERRKRERLMAARKSGLA